MAGHLELFTLAKVFVVRRRSLDLVVQAETVQTFPELRTDLNRLPYAYQAVEAAHILVEEEVEAHAEFVLLVKALGALATTAALPLVLVAYKLQLLAILGYQAQFQACARCGNPLSEDGNRLRPDSGGVVCAACGGVSGSPLTVRAIKCLRWLAKEPLLTVERLQVGLGHNHPPRTDRRYICALCRRARSKNHALSGAYARVENTVVKGVTLAVKIRHHGRDCKPL